MFVEGGLHPKQIEGLRTMTVQRRLELSLEHIEQMYELRAAMLRYEHPGWSEEQLAEALRKSMRDGGS